MNLLLHLDGFLIQYLRSKRHVPACRLASTHLPLNNCSASAWQTTSVETQDRTCCQFTSCVSRTRCSWQIDSFALNATNSWEGMKAALSRLTCGCSWHKLSCVHLLHQLCRARYCSGLEAAMAKTHRCPPTLSEAISYSVIAKIYIFSYYLCTHLDCCTNNNSSRTFPSSFVLLAAPGSCFRFCNALFLNNPIPDILMNTRSSQWCSLCKTWKTYFAVQGSEQRTRPCKAPLSLLVDGIRHCTQKKGAG